MNKTTIFTDGSSRGNPGKGGWGSGVVEKDKVTELGGREDDTTNNRMELEAVIAGLSTTEWDEEIIVNTDSSYVINGITKWVHGWKRNGWVTKTKDEVLNRDLWERLVEVKEGKDIKWNYVGGHAGIVGNERCDEIATSFADGDPIKLYKGPISDYPIKNILDLTQVIEKASKKSHSKAQAYSYISMVDGKIEKHKTWAECEARVKGKSGTRYRKAISLDQEQQIIAEFSKF
jgi:ribonuclease HI